MEDPAALLKDKEDGPSIEASREYDNLYQLELKYWSIRTLRRTVRYSGCLALTGQLVAALFCFIAAPWADSTERSRNLKFAGCILLSTFSGSCLFFSLAAVAVAWVTSVKAHVGNALLFAGFHIKSLVYSSCACAISASLLKCFGLQTAPLNFESAIACTCVVLLHLLVQPVPLGGFWAVCASSFLVFIVGSQKLVSALAEGTLPKSYFAFVGLSHLWWLSPLILAAALAAVLLLCHYIELLQVVSRGGYHIFCPPNPHLCSLDDLARDAVQGRPLSLSPCKPRRPPSVAAFVQLYREKLSPRLQGPAIAQQRRTVGSPIPAAPRPAANDHETTLTDSKVNTNYQQKASSEGAWLVALWLRGPFFLGSLGALCIALALGLYAVASDSGAAFHGASAFDEISRLLLPTQHRPVKEFAASFVPVHEQQLSDGEVIPLARSFLQNHNQQRQQDGKLFSSSQHRRWQHRSRHLIQVLQAPTPSAENLAGGTLHDPVVKQPDATATPSNSFLQMRPLDDPQPNKAHNQHGMKSAAALLLLALVLLTPLLGSSLGEWVEDMFFAHMVMIKRNPWMLVPPPTLFVHPRKPVLEPAKATKEAPPSTKSSEPLLHLAQERMTHQTPQHFLGLDAQPKQEQQSERQEGQQPRYEQEQQP